ncbi:MAG: hypothetical protein ACNA8L_04710 [Luteolibacter sp.]
MRRYQQHRNNPKAREHDIRLYGFCAAGSRDGTIPLNRIFPHFITMLTGDQRNIGALACAYHGKSLGTGWNGSEFAKPDKKK